MFCKRELDKKMDRKQLSEFFRDCGYFIPASGIHRVFQLVSPGKVILKNALQWYKKFYCRCRRLWVVCLHCIKKLLLLKAQSRQTLPDVDVLFQNGPFYLYT